MTEKEQRLVTVKALRFMYEQVKYARKARDWEWCKTPEAFWNYKKNCQAWVCCTCMFAQQLLNKKYATIVYKFSNKCREQIENL